MYVIMKERQTAVGFNLPQVHEVTKSLQVAKDRCRTLNRAAQVNRYWYERVTPIIDAKGTKANPKTISM